MIAASSTRAAWRTLQPYFLESDRRACQKCSARVQWWSGRRAPVGLLKSSVPTRNVQKACPLRAMSTICRREGPHMFAVRPPEENPVRSSTNIEASKTWSEKLLIACHGPGKAHGVEVMLRRAAFLRNLRVCQALRGEERSPLLVDFNFVLPSRLWKRSNASQQD